MCLRHVVQIRRQCTRSSKNITHDKIFTATNKTSIIYVIIAHVETAADINFFIVADVDAWPEPTVAGSGRYRFAMPRAARRARPCSVSGVRRVRHDYLAYKAYRLIANGRLARVDTVWIECKDFSPLTLLLRCTLRQSFLFHSQGLGLDALHAVLMRTGDCYRPLTAGDNSVRDRRLNVLFGAQIE
ncbi:hypothetical protein EVAR_77242_1 [Eumeta japonica]|uniref:Uncharacterized protein n=1 Tax=Eumeta variegata TaxID=151549 RepID=A0A4C1ULM8_EUMVA|nr:hypothetical protein EVAR_77242_1 [Eumeta japonica]